MQTQSARLSDEEIQVRLLGISDWQLERGELQSTFSLASFPQAIFFVDAIAHIAEVEQHHPDIGIAYDKVTLRIATHSAGGITEKDFKLARRVNQLWQVLSAL
ncbi:putative pterin-4-alpha-carbinolamine dehydratase [Dictyobacter alpinus]|uniref:Putative pterin-4-alpha-carbinolamine dehydratase n=1 Tax=Dictyobacter alpinus TaxID=2014873 RepID=A0A402BH82_9CHLR|nr:4a-hydroxytetrahydrobiopterin dehydratase [Dictyobacter alpinus]GCE30771.1 putative pterin-4-alpha-carbinolamine dehydratase [Dictyobacter alpinus]